MFDNFPVSQPAMPFEAVVSSVANGFIVRVGHRCFVVQAEGSGSDQFEAVLDVLREAYERTHASEQ